MTPQPVPVPDLGSSTRALELFHEAIPPQFFDALQTVRSNAVYTPCLTVWLLVYQRLFGNATLHAAVAHCLEVVAGRSTNKRVRDKTLSTNTAAYSQARSRLTVTTAEAVADHVSTSLLGPPPPEGRTFLFDGTTVALASNPQLRARWPAGSNQHGPGNWPICHLAVAHDLETGLAVRAEVGAMYGPAADSELSLALRLLPRIPANSVLMADRNFGIFAFVHAAAQAGHHTLTRLTQPRFQSMARGAKKVGPGRWTLAWTPSKHDRKNRPDLATDAEVIVQLHEFVGFSGQTLGVVTTLDVAVEKLAALYARRWEIEADIRHLKQTLQADALRGQSPEMVLKELAMTAVAYNLVVQVRRLAAERAKVAPKRIRFSAVRDLVRILLFDPKQRTAAEWVEWFERVLHEAGRSKLPNRPNRSYPREVIPRRRGFPDKKRTVKAVK